MVRALAVVALFLSGCSGGLLELDLLALGDFEVGVFALLAARSEVLELSTTFTPDELA